MIKVKVEKLMIKNHLSKLLIWDKKKLRGGTEKFFFENVQVNPNSKEKMRKVITKVSQKICEYQSQKFRI